MTAIRADEAFSFASFSSSASSASSVHSKGTIIKLLGIIPAHEREFFLFVHDVLLI